MKGDRSVGQPSGQSSVHVGQIAPRLGFMPEDLTTVQADEELVSLSQPAFRDVALKCEAVPHLAPKDSPKVYF